MRIWRIAGLTPTFFFVGIWGDKKKKLLDSLAYALNPKCAAAFAAAGVETVASQINNGITFIAENLVRNPADDVQWSPAREMAQGMRNMYAEHPSTNDVTAIGAYRGDGRRYVSLANRAFTEMDDYFSVSLVHSLIHSGGKGQQSRHFTGQSTDPIYNGKTGMETTPGRPIYEASRHDLEWLGAGYNGIVENCTREGSSRIGPARGR